MAIITRAPPQRPRYDFPIKKRPRHITLFIRPPRSLRHLAKFATANRHTAVCLFAAVRPAFSQVQILGLAQKSNRRFPAVKFLARPAGLLRHLAKFAKRKPAYCRLPFCCGSTCFFAGSNPEACIIIKKSPVG